MLSFTRRLSKSSFGTIILLLFVVVMGISFAMADLSQTRQGASGQGGDTLVGVGSERVSDRDMSDAMQRALTQLRQQKPDATYADLADQYDGILDQLANEATMAAFATDHGFVLSRRLVDAQIATIPQTKGLDGKFSQANYEAFLQQNQMTDAAFRRIISGALIQRQILAPAAVDYKVPLGVARPYASMLLEQRDGEFALIPTDLFTAGLDPSDGDLQAFYGQNRQRYLVPEQRVVSFARITEDSIAPAPPTDKEIADYYNANKALYAGNETRVISQAVVQDKAQADGIAARAKAGGSFAAAAAPAGLSAADVSVGPQTKDQFARLAGASVADTTFKATTGTVIGPVRSDLGWHVIKVDEVRAAQGRSLDQARAEISAKLTEEKRKGAVAETINSIQDSIDDGASFSEVAAANKLQVVTTPAINAGGTSLTNAAYVFPENAKPALTAAFQMASGDDPEIVSLPENQGYLLVGLDSVIPSAPAPLAQIKDRVRADWIIRKANERAKAVADSIAKKVAGGEAMDKAVSEAGVRLPPVQEVSARRIQLSQANPDAATALKMLFSLGSGKSRMVADPQGRGFFVVKTLKIVPGDASGEPALIAQTAAAFQQTSDDEIAAQFVAAMKAEQGVKRNEKAIAASKQRITATGN